MTLKTTIKSVMSNDTSSQTHRNTAKEKFHSEIVNKNVLAISNIRSEDFDIEGAKNKSNDALTALGADNSLQKMVAAQMLSIHELQQETMAYANGVESVQNKQYFVNAAIKLANCFTQQATLLAKLQGQLAQKMTIERVDVHHGGQAVVGNVCGVTPTNSEKK